ncbi:amidase [Spinactinospora alkalitolerans]|uniref:Amidase n=1 Tax=Spinactinospora alkalitolerans TaxID=687207 RepID=A0A852TYH5_9ACTN|nr:amidase [Spinactinospora alkalitolerans]NYE48042.1 amidase [Spinactinospora alkalitolerans]
MGHDDRDPEGQRVDVTELSIEQTLEYLNAGQLTSVDLVCAYLNRIAYYDRSGTCLNAVPVLNPDVLSEAEASDERRARGDSLGPLEGVPFTVKDSFKARGLTVASGSPAFEELVATGDAASVELLRDAGAVLLGKTTMPPMAAGGVQPGVYGYAKSPYHPGYLTAAYGSGSSNGAGTAVAASFCSFGLAEETLSSGRSPASNNGLVAYTPSRGLISIRGNWPLFPTCDVVVPYARSVDDLLRLLDVLVAEDADTSGDFWRSQRFVDLPALKDVRPPSFLRTRREDLTGLRLGVPRMFTGSDPHKLNPVAFRTSVEALWNRATEDLVALGAEVIPVDFPVVSNYETDRPEAQGLVERGLVDANWQETEMGPMIARAWDEFLQYNGMDGLSSLEDVDGDQIFPDMPAEVYANAGTAFDFVRLVELAKAGLPGWNEMQGIGQSLHGLEQARRDDFESWLTKLGLDAVVFPTNGDVAAADLFERPERMEEALRNGVLFSNGNRTIRHLGIPTVNVPMGRMADISMPVGMTIAGPAYSDDLLLDIASAYEARTCRRPAPPLTPSLPSGIVDWAGTHAGSAHSHDRVPPLTVSTDVSEDASGWQVRSDIRVSEGQHRQLRVQAWLDGCRLTVRGDLNGGWTATGRVSRQRARLDNYALLIVKASAAGCRPAAHWECLVLPEMTTIHPQTT